MQHRPVSGLSHPSLWSRGPKGRDHKETTTGLSRSLLGGVVGLRRLGSLGPEEALAPDGPSGLPVSAGTLLTAGVTSDVKSSRSNGQFFTVGEETVVTVKHTDSWGVRSMLGPAQANVAGPRRGLSPPKGIR